MICSLFELGQMSAFPSGQSRVALYLCLGIVWVFPPSGSATGFFCNVTPPPGVGTPNPGWVSPSPRGLRRSLIRITGLLGRQHPHNFDLLGGRCGFGSSPQVVLALVILVDLSGYFEFIFYFYYETFNKGLNPEPFQLHFLDPRGWTSTRALFDIFCLFAKPPFFLWWTILEFSLSGGGGFPSIWAWTEQGQWTGIRGGYAVSFSFYPSGF